MLFACVRPIEQLNWLHSVACCRLGVVSLQQSLGTEWLWTLIVAVVKGRFNVWCIGQWR